MLDLTGSGSAASEGPKILEEVRRLNKELGVPEAHWPSKPDYYKNGSWLMTELNRDVAELRGYKTDDAPKAEKPKRKERKEPKELSESQKTFINSMSINKLKALIAGLGGDYEGITENKDQLRQVAMYLMMTPDEEEEAASTASPAPPECLWEPVEDDSSGQTYYYHVETREVTWSMPDEYAQAHGIEKSPDPASPEAAEEKDQQDIFSADHQLPPSIPGKGSIKFKTTPELLEIIPRWDKGMGKIDRARLLAGFMDVPIAGPEDPQPPPEESEPTQRGPPSGSYTPPFARAKQPSKGARVRIKDNVKGQAGAMGTLEKYLAKKDKWGVKLDSGKRVGLNADSFVVQ